MNTADHIRQSIAASLGIPWRQLRLRVVDEPDEVRGRWWGIEVHHGGRWQRPPAHWDLSVPRREVTGWLLGTARWQSHLLLSGHYGFDRCCGGGLRKGSTAVVSGIAGSNKTTLVLDVVHGLARRGHKVIFAPARENRSDVRRKLLAMDLRTSPNLLVMDQPKSQSWQEIEAAVRRAEPAVVVVDDFQLVHGCGESIVSAARSVRDGRWRPTFVFVGRSDGSHAITKHEVDLHLQIVQGGTIDERGWSTVNLVTRKNRHGQTGVVSIYSVNPGGRLIPRW